MRKHSILKTHRQPLCAANKTMIEPRKPMSRGAFTLVELLIGIAVILVLAGLILPAAKNIMLKAHGAKCISNLRQWAVVFNVYIYDNNGTFPSANPFPPPDDGRSWQYPTAPLNSGIASENITNWYLGNAITGCPAHSSATRYYSYVYNYCLQDYRPNHYPGLTIFTVARKSQVIVLADSVNSSDPQQNETIFSDNYGQEKRIGFPHGGKYNALYVDGHVGSSDIVSLPLNVIPVP